MNLKDWLARQLTYDAWANQELLGYLVGSEPIPDEAWRLYDHVLGASENWLARILQRQPELAIWPALDHESRPRELTRLAQAWRDLVSGLADDELEASVSYSNSKGTAYSTKRLDVLHQVLAHAHYHRGQIASVLRRSLIDPPWVDPIVWTRLHPDQ